MRGFQGQKLLVSFFLLASVIRPAFADRTAGTNAVVSNLTHTSASFSASITTDANGTGTYPLAFFYKEASATSYLSLAPTPTSVALSGNATTSFVASISTLTCGKSYAVTGAFLRPGDTQYTRVGTTDTVFATLECATITPSSLSLKYFTGSAITPATLSTANFNGTPTFQITPSLPAGFSFDTATGAISGTPTVAKTDTRHTITANGAVSGTATVTLNLTVAPALTDLEVLRYIASQPDLIDAFGTNIAKGRQHYLDWGFNEGRKITFDPLSYTASHGDLIGAFGTDETKAVTHYIQWGFKEKRQTTFSSLRYIASHPDLIEAFGADADKGVRHYINWGFKEGRKITFDPLRYTASHPDLIQAFAGDETKAVTHYIQAGYREKRQTTFSDLDALQFIASYADLITSLGTDVVAGIRNYVEKGYQAGRRILFDALTYIASHGDLIAAFGTDAVAGVKHYINWGYKEGRKVVFDALGYLAAHSDLRSAFGADTAAATRHFINWGFKEGRTYLWTVSATAGTGGRVSSARSYAKTNEKVTLTVSPDTGYAIDSVTGCGGSLSGTTFTTAPITGTCAITASFKPTTVNLTIVAQYQKPGPALTSGATPQWSSPVTAPIPYVWIELQNAVGQVVGSGYADEKGQKLFSGISVSAASRVVFRSRALTPNGLDLWVVNNTLPAGPGFSSPRTRYAPHFASTSLTLSATDKDQTISLTAPTGWNATTNTLDDARRTSGPFVILADSVKQQVATGEAGAVNSIKMLTIFWSTKNTDGGEEINFDKGLDSGSGGFYLSCTPRILADGRPDQEGGRFRCAGNSEHMIFLSGSQDASYSVMELSPTVTVHELTHFTQGSSMRRYSPGGNHNSFEYQDIPMAHHEGFATGAATLIAGSARLETYRKTGGQIFSSVSDYSRSLSGSPQGWFQERSFVQFIWSLFDPSGPAKLTAKEVYSPYYSTTWRTGTFVPNIWAYGRLLKDVRPDKAAVIDQLAANVNITLTGNDFLGSAERIRGDRTDKQTFPVITTVPLSGTVEVCSAGTPYEYNKSSNRRYLQILGDGKARKFTITGPQSTVPTLFDDSGSYFEKGKSSFSLTLNVPVTGDWASIGDCRVANYQTKESENGACADTDYTPPTEQCWTIKVE
jgi:Divergent InlB B-repeat domain/Putative Ig domain